MGSLYVNFVGLHVSVIHMTIIRSVRAKDFVMQQRFPERNGIPLYFTLLDGHVNKVIIITQRYGRY